MRTLYVDGAQEAAKIMQLERKITARLEAVSVRRANNTNRLEAAAAVKLIMDGRSSVRVES